MTSTYRRRLCYYLKYTAIKNLSRNIIIFLKKKKRFRSVTNSTLTCFYAYSFLPLPHLLFHHSDRIFLFGSTWDWREDLFSVPSPRDVGDCSLSRENFFFFFWFVVDSIFQEGEKLWIFYYWMVNFCKIWTRFCAKSFLHFPSKGCNNIFFLIRQLLSMGLFCRWCHLDIIGCFYF